MKRFAYLLMLISWPNAGFGQASALGAAAGFAVFTAVGAFSSVGATAVTGDIGTGAGAFTGFPPGVVVGQIHVADAASAQAATAVHAAWAALSSVPCGPVTLGTTLGNNQLLRPGVYCLGAATTLNGKVILDGENNPNALFIFKIDGAFATSTSARVSLINGASADRVFWQINGQVDLGVSAVFSGTIVATGAINLLNGASLVGRALSRAGAISLHNAAVSTVAVVLLPVTLVSFSATQQGSTALLQWSTASEQGSRSFIVEHSNSAQPLSWQALDTLAAAGNSSSVRHYRLVAANLNQGPTYYRLRSTDLTGAYTTSGVQTVYVGEAAFQSVQAFPNPVTTSLTVTGARPGSCIRVVSMTGKTVQEGTASGTGTQQLPTAPMPTGIYLLQTVAADGRVITHRLHKQ